MLTVRPVQGSGQFCAKVDVGLYATFAYGSSPENALFRLERHASLGEYMRRIVTEVHRRLTNWHISYAELHAGINTGTIVLPTDWMPVERAQILSRQAQGG